MKRVGVIMVPISEELSRELGAYELAWPAAKAQAARHGGRLTGEHWVQREPLYDQDTGESLGVLVRYVWKMVEP